MRILIADQLPADVRGQLAGLGFEVDFQPSLGAEELPEAIGDAQVLVVRSTRVTAEAITASPRLQLIIRAGAGTNTIDCQQAADRGVFVANCPGKNAIAVAELTMGLILSLDRRIPDGVADLRAGRWRKKVYSKSRGLYGRTLGVIGVGRIGAEVLTRAGAFGLKCIAWSRSLHAAGAEKLGVERCESVMEVCRRADIVTVHVARTPETQHLIGAEEIAAMPDGAYLLNMARGGVVDDAAVKAAVDAGRIRAAADVFEQEPGASMADFESPLGGVADFYGSHHIGASTEQAQSAIASEVLGIIEYWLKAGRVRNTVNLSSQPPASGQLLVRHLDRVGVLATVLDVLKRANINVQDMHNTIFKGAVAACARITVEQVPEQDTLAALAACSPEVLGVEYFPA